MPANLLILITHVLAAWVFFLAWSGLSARGGSRFRVWRFSALVYVLAGLLLYLPSFGLSLWLYLKLVVNVTYVIAAFWLGLLVLLGAVVTTAAATREVSGRGLRGVGWPLKKLWLAVAVMWLIHLLSFPAVSAIVSSRMDGVRREAGALALDAAPPIPPEQQNAAPLWLRAAEQRPEQDPPPMFDVACGLDEDTPLDPDDPALLAYLEACAPAFALADQAAQRDAFYIERDYANITYQTLLPELGPMRWLARAICARAAVRAHHDDLSGALSDIALISRLAEHAETDTVVICRLVGISIRVLAIDALGRTLQSGAPSSEDWDVWPGWARADPSRMLQRSLQLEQASIMNTMALIVQEELDITASIRGLSESEGAVGLAAFMHRVFMGEYELAGVDRAMAGMRYIASLSIDQVPDALDRHDVEADFAYTGMLTRTMAPALTAYIDAELEAECLARVAETGVALERYRLKHRRAPDNLAQLVPEFLPAVPADLFNPGQPLTYLQQGDTVMIYSIGKNRRDDLGKARSTGVRDYDLVMVLPAERPNE